MKKTLKVALIVLILLLIISQNILADSSANGLIISFFPGINYPFEVETITCAIGVFGLILPSFHGYASSLFFNSVKDYSEGFGSAIIFQTYLGGFNGFLITGGFNFINKNYDGFEISGFANLNFASTTGIQISMLNYNSGDFKGFQVGLLNLNMSDFEGFRIGLVSFSNNFKGKADISILASLNFSDFKGFQASLLNLNTGDFDGLQIGLVNLDLKSFEGYRIGLLSISNIFKGVQIGLVNFCVDFQGLQIGIINIAKYENGFSFGLFNFFLKGYNAIETTYNEQGILKINFKWGSKKFYTIMGIGMDSSQTIYQNTLGFGTHIPIGYFFFDIELFTQGRASQQNLENYLSNLSNLYWDNLYYNGYYYYYDNQSNFVKALGYLILGDSTSISLRFNCGVNLGFFQIIAGITYNLGFKVNPENGSFSWYIPSGLSPILEDINNFAFFQYGWFGFTLGVQFQL